MNSDKIILSVLIQKNLRDRFVKAVKAKGFSFRKFYQELFTTAIKNWLEENEAK